MNHIHLVWVWVNNLMVHTRKLLFHKTKKRKEEKV